MTRNEYIAETAARFYTTLDLYSQKSAIDEAINLANELEGLELAPWHNESALTKLQTEQQMKNYATSSCHKCGQSHAIYGECPQSSKGA